jgi:GDP-L-fucose synthase
MSRFLVTGGNGFIGRNLAAYLKRQPDQDSVSTIGREFDLRDASRAGAAFKDSGAFDYIIHLADVQGDARWSAQNAATQFMANARITLNVLEAWYAWQPQAHLICLSSLWAYPESVVEARESDYWNGRMHKPTEHYGINKKILGIGMESFKRQHGLKGTSLVLGSVYGPGDSTTHVIPSLLKRMQDNPTLLEIWGDGTSTRDFIFIEDQIKGILQHRDYDGELLNIGTGTSYSIRQVVETLARLMDYKGKIVYDASKGGAVVDRRINVDLACQTTGWPENFKLHTLEEGLIKTVNAFKNSNSTLIK